MNVDLHCHSTASDGSLTPAELVKLAIEREVDLLSITDHDTLNAYHHGLDSLPINLVAGIELSTSWRKFDIHIVGLNIDVAHESILTAVQLQTDARNTRATRIADKLESVGIQDSLKGARIEAGGGQIGRLHFARYLVSIGAVKTIQQAFKKYLGKGKACDVKTSWATMENVINWIEQAGGTAVLAHPVKYGLTWTKLKLLLTDFKNCNGKAIEVISGRQDKHVTSELASLANKYQFLSSCGSDFHVLNKAWAALGQVEKLPSGCLPVWEHW